MLSRNFILALLYVQVQIIILIKKYVMLLIKKSYIGPVTGYLTREVALGQYNKARISTIPVTC